MNVQLISEQTLLQCRKILHRPSNRFQKMLLILLKVQKLLYVQFRLSVMKQKKKLQTLNLNLKVKSARLMNRLTASRIRLTSAQKALKKSLQILFQKLFLKAKLNTSIFLKMLILSSMPTKRILNTNFHRFRFLMQILIPLKRAFVPQWVKFRTEFFLPSTTLLQARDKNTKILPQKLKTTLPLLKTKSKKSMLLLILLKKPQLVI